MHELGPELGRPPRLQNFGWSDLVHPTRKLLLGAEIVPLWIRWSSLTGSGETEWSHFCQYKAIHFKLRTSTSPKIDKQCASKCAPRWQSTSSFRVLSSARVKKYLFVHILCFNPLQARFTLIWWPLVVYRSFQMCRVLVEPCVYLPQHILSRLHGWKTQYPFVIDCYIKGTFVDARLDFHAINISLFSRCLWQVISFLPSSDEKLYQGNSSEYCCTCTFHSKKTTIFSTHRLLAGANERIDCSGLLVCLPSAMRLTCHMPTSKCNFSSWMAFCSFVTLCDKILSRDAYERSRELWLHLSIQQYWIPGVHRDFWSNDLHPQFLLNSKLIQFTVTWFPWWCMRTQPSAFLWLVIFLQDTLHFVQSIHSDGAKMFQAHALPKWSNQK